ncbi:aldose epimerase family protein [Flavitalea sp. BT771]|uniref:aldose epimerase family protein n=1 Tax=Flavitalea sp. BT771 TaxID=3063329 RepID=UPI0026E43E29|nr:aldose epimerase family protein [Flavitalea sp. BT771]MDO6431051.1 aldose epimerase family protein [Flavitalea sp. BT771]MDV6219958.1 aldose epimerase family protein [Flavitalea sp. BT771]
MLSTERTYTAGTLSWSNTLYDKLDGQEVYWITLKNGATTVRITNIGCSITSIHTPDRHGVQRNIVAGFDSPVDYLRNPWYFGCIIGRYVNRIGGGRFHLDGQAFQLSRNDDGNHLHGGFGGFHRKIWGMGGAILNAQEVGVIFEYTSPDGEEGYPGNLQVRVKYTLDQQNRLALSYTAVTDRRTPVNLANHSYFNLTGFDDPLIANHRLMIHAKAYTEKSTHNLPTGNLLPLAGTPLDLSAAARIGDRIGQLAMDKGFDHNYVLDGIRPAAALYDPLSGRMLRVTTDQPGIQVYTANWWDGAIKGAHPEPYRQHGAIALETQAFPDSPNRPDFPSTILNPGETYHANTVFEFDLI